MINFNTANPLQPAVSVYKFMQPCLLFCGEAQWHMRRVRWTLTVKGATFKVWSNKFTASARPGERERERKRERERGGERERERERERGRERMGDW